MYMADLKPIPIERTAMHKIQLLVVYPSTATVIPGTPRLITAIRRRKELFVIQSFDIMKSDEEEKMIPYRKIASCGKALSNPF